MTCPRYSRFLVHLLVPVAALLLSAGCEEKLDDYEGDDPAECTDGADNDRDGMFDCDDPGCQGSPLCDGDDDDDDTVPDDDDSDDDDDDDSADDDDDDDSSDDDDDTTEADADGDGYTPADGDCDDGNASINPGADEACDDVDNDCDGDVDEADAVDTTTWYADADGDGYGDDGVTIVACDQPSGFITTAGDCDDGDAAVNPDADETCDGIDNDCDGSVDEADALDAGTWYADADGDGHGDAGTSTVACDQPTGYVSSDDDCDDGDAGA